MTKICYKHRFVLTSILLTYLSHAYATAHSANRSSRYDTCT